MPGAQERILRRRIKSVQATMKITRAMELIAASRIMKAQARLKASAPYESALESALAGVLHEAGRDGARFTEVSGDGPTGLCVMVADRGLCGGYNMSVLRAATGQLKRLAGPGEESAEGGSPSAASAVPGGSGGRYRLVTVGKKAVAYFRFRGYEITEQFTGFSDKPGFEDASRIAAALVEPYMAGELSKVVIVSTRYRSAGSQAVEARQVLPLSVPPELAALLGMVLVEGGGSAEHNPAESGPTEAGGSMGASAETAPASGAPGGRGSALLRAGSGYLETEPEPADLLSLLVPRYVEAAVFAALLEAAASELSFRQRAMAAATDNAEEIVKTLTRAVNRVRQDAITTEIMEIVGGAEALREAEEE